MRVLHVAHGFPPLNRAGAEVFADGLCRALRHRGHEIEVFCGRQDLGLPDLGVESATIDGLSVTRINRHGQGPTGEGFSATYLHAAVRVAFASVLDRFRPQIVEIHHLAGLSIDLVEEAADRGIPVVFTLHDYWLICQRGQFLKPDLTLCQGQEDRACAECFAGVLSRGSGARTARWLEERLPKERGPSLAGKVRRVLGPVGRAVVGRQRGAIEEVSARMDRVRAACSRVARFIAPSRYLLERHLELGISPERLVYSRYGFAVGGYDHPRRTAGGRVRFGYLGSWIPPKGLHVLLEAFERLDDERATLHVYGEAVPYDGVTGYEARLEAHLDSDRVERLGRYDNARVGEILAGLDVLVFPSIWFENSPLTVQEAGLAGVPVIASDLGAIPELVEDGVNGLTFRARSAEDLCEKMRLLLDEEGLLERLRSGAQCAVKSLDACAEEREQIYREVLEESRP